MLHKQTHTHTHAQLRARERVGVGEGGLGMGRAEQRGRSRSSSPRERRTARMDETGERDSARVRRGAAGVDAPHGRMMIDRTSQTLIGRCAVERGAGLTRLDCRPSLRPCVCERVGEEERDGACGLCEGAERCVSESVAGR